MKKKIAWLIAAILLCAIFVHSQTDPNVTVKVDLGDNGSSSTQPSSGFDPLKGFGEFWNSLTAGAQSATPIQSFNPQVEIALDPNAAWNGVCVTGRDLGPTKQYSAAIRVQQGSEKSKVVQTVPLSSAVPKQCILLPVQATPGESLWVMAVLNNPDGSYLATGNPIPLVAPNTAARHTFFELPPDFLSLSPEEQKTAFQNANSPLTSLPSNEQAVKLVFSEPLAPLESKGSTQASGTVSTNDSPMVNFNATILDNSTLPGQDLFNKDPNRIWIEDSPLSGGSRTMKGELLLQVVDPNQTQNSASGAVPVIIDNPQGTVSVSYNLWLNFLGIEGNTPTTVPSVYRNSFELPRQSGAGATETTATNQPSIVLKDDQGKTVSEIDTAQLEKIKSVCLSGTAKIKEFWDSLPPAERMLEIWAESQKVSEFVGPPADLCNPTDKTKLSPAIQSALENGASKIMLQLKAAGKVLAETSLSIRLPATSNQLKIGKMVGANGKEISGSLVDPVQPVSLEISGIDSGKALYVFATPAGEKQDCTDLAKTLKEFASEMDTLNSLLSQGKYPAGSAAILQQFVQFSDSNRDRFPAVNVGTQKKSEPPKVCFYNGSCVAVELAQTESEWETGLMFRAALEKETGMLFVFDQEAEHDLWMKNTSIPLDFLWIDAKGKIVGVKENAQPCVEAAICPNYSAGTGIKAKYVLETNAGFISANGIGEGQTVQINLSGSAANKSLGTAFGQKKFLLSVSATELQENQTVQLSFLQGVSDSDLKRLYGESFVLNACQFGDFVSPFSGLAVFPSGFASTSPIQFGKMKDGDYLNALVRADQKFLDGLFSKAVFENGVPMIQAAMIYFGETKTDAEIRQNNSFFESAFSTAVQGKVRLKIDYKGRKPFPTDAAHNYAGTLAKYPWLNGSEKAVWFGENEKALHNDVKKAFADLGVNRNSFDVSIALTDAVVALNGDVTGGLFFPFENERPILFIPVSYINNWTEKQAFSNIPYSKEAIAYHVTHEMGHFMGLGHACSNCNKGWCTAYSCTVDDDCCSACQWKDDVMSYCAATKTEMLEKVGVFGSCTLNFVTTKFTPAFASGQTVLQAEGSCNQNIS